VWVLGVLGGGCNARSRCAPHATRNAEHPTLSPGFNPSLPWHVPAVLLLSYRPTQVVASTWNVAEGKPNRPSIERWLGERARHAQLLLIGLQEVEMGTGSVALDVVYQQLAKSKLEAGTQVGRCDCSTRGPTARGGSLEAQARLCVVLSCMQPRHGLCRGCMFQDTRTQQVWRSDALSTMRAAEAAEQGPGA
jgi:hypothetical protein